MALQPGSVAPDFTLVDSALKLVSLQDFRGRPVLILFFPLAFSGVCTREFCLVRDDMARYNQLNAQVLGISVDSLFALGKFKEEQKLDFILLSDFNKEVSAAYGCLYENYFGMHGVSKRSAFVIDPAGTIVYAEVLENSDDLPDFAKINDALAGMNTPA